MQVNIIDISCLKNVSNIFKMNGGVSGKGSLFYVFAFSSDLSPCP